MVTLAEDGLGTIRNAFPKEGLFAEKDWLLSPDAFPIDKTFARELEQLGHRLFVFQRACNQLYQLSVKGKQPEWVARYLDAGKPPELIEFSRRKEIRDDLPRVIRPDLVLTENGYVIAEIDSVPGGIGLTGWLNQTYSAFDKEIIDSMARVVSSKNLLAAASNEGAALLVKRTKDAEAEAAYKTIGAEAEKKASALRGEGLALFRKNIADGMKDAAESLKAAGVDANFLLFLEYTDALKYVAEHGQGKVIFMDNSATAATKVVQGILGMDAEMPPAGPEPGAARGN